MNELVYYKEYRGGLLVINPELPLIDGYYITLMRDRQNNPDIQLVSARYFIRNQNKRKGSGRQHGTRVKEIARDQALAYDNDLVSFEDELDKYHDNDDLLRFIIEMLIRNIISPNSYIHQEVVGWLRCSEDNFLQLCAANIETETKIDLIQCLITDIDELKNMLDI
jgi:hypothetical protein